jgi:hypothetical protein
MRRLRHKTILCQILESRLATASSLGKMLGRVALSDVSGLQPKDDRGLDDHRPLVDGALLVAGGQASPLLELVDAALDHVAPPVGGLVEGQQAAGSGRSLIRGATPATGLDSRPARRRGCARSRMAAPDAVNAHSQ